MKFQKRAVQLLVSLALLFFIAVPANAAGDLEGAKDAIIAGMEQRSDRIDLTSFNLSQDEIAELDFSMDYCWEVPWFVTSGYIYTDPWEGQVFYHAWYLDESIYAPEPYEAAVQKILDATVHEGMEDWQLALSIHDYLVSHHEYDLTYEKYTGYELLTTGSSVCEGYTRAYRDLLRRVGIPTYYVASNPMNHAWCLVQIGGEWYHVDATWDDPVPDSTGRARHAFFLLSDNKISDAEHEHFDWISDISATSTRFDSGMFWENVDSPIIYLDADTCILRRNDGPNCNIYRRDASTGTETLLFSVKTSILDSGYYYQVDGLSYWNGSIYFNDLDRVFCLSPETGEATVVYNYDTSTEQKFIYSTIIIDGTIRMTLMDTSYNVETVEVPLPTDHTHSFSDMVTAPTCGAGGYTTHTCTVCGYTYSDNKTDALNHIYTARLIYATCTEMGYTEYTCENCGDSFQIDPRPAYGHRWDSGSVTTAPTLGAEGLLTYTCTVCHVTETETIPPLQEEECSHSSTTRKGQLDATCTEAGYTGDLVCAACYEKLEMGTVLSATGHAFGDWIELIPPSSTAAGQESRSCSLCGCTETRELAALVNPFTDVAVNAYYEIPVLWAVKNNITTGMTDTTFVPAAKCTRAQVVTFLWRAAGEPEPTTSQNPFVDVKEKDYFYEAVLWAVEKGITKGLDATHFGYKSECTRGQVATFLWRAQGEPSTVNSNHPFTDIKPGDYFYEAVLWAVEHEVTKGTSDTTFAPADTCTRGQVVTFLYRAMT